MSTVHHRCDIDWWVPLRPAGNGSAGWSWTECFARRAEMPGAGTGTDGDAGVGKGSVGAAVGTHFNYRRIIIEQNPVPEDAKTDLHIGVRSGVDSFDLEIPPLLLVIKTFAPPDEPE